jgi:hypothetical protein
MMVMTMTKTMTMAITINKTSVKRETLQLCSGQAVKREMEPLTHHVSRFTPHLY